MQCTDEGLLSKHLFRKQYYRYVNYEKNLLLYNGNICTYRSKSLQKRINENRSHYCRVLLLLNFHKLNTVSEYLINHHSRPQTEW